MSRAPRLSKTGIGELAIVLGGGGARAAYQVGVLRGVARHLSPTRSVILTGESAGAINAAFLAAHPAPIAEAIEDLARLWSGLTVDQVFRVGVPSLARNVLRWAARLMSGGLALAPTPRGLLDTGPLRSLLERAFESADGEIVGISRKIEKGLLTAIALTTLNYATGQTVTWVQGEQIQGWERPLRRSVAVQLSVDHVLASAALPFVFPAVRLGDDWYGDGGVRLHTPLSPAIHLGAGRILAISTRYRPTYEEAARPAIHGYPAPAHVAGLLLDAIFLDLVDYDALVLQRLNALLAKLPPAEWAGFRPVDLLVLRPSRDLAEFARSCEACLPRGLRFLTRGLGTRETSRADFLTLMMFVPEYLEELIRIGERDAEAHAADIAKFLEQEP